MKQFFCLLMALFSCVLLSAQGYGWMSALDDPNANFYDLRDSARAYFQANPDAPMQKEFGRWELFWTPRVGDSLNAGSFIPAMEQWSALIENCISNPICETSNVNYRANWTALGPFTKPLKDGTNDTSNGVGRTFAIELAPDDPTFNTVYVGTETSGFWKTTNALDANPDKVSWTNPSLDNRMPSIGVKDIAIDPFNPNTIYIATGTGNPLTSRYGLGVLKSTDGGDTWCETALFYDGVEDRFCHKVVPHPSIQDKWFATNRTQLHVTTDGWATKSTVTVQNGISSSKQYYNELEFSPDNSDILFLASDDIGAEADGAHFFRSTDGGVNWNELDLTPFLANFSNPFVRRIDIAVSNVTGAKNIVYLGVVGDDGGSNFRLYLRSANNGASWSIMTATGSGGGSINMHDIKVSTIDENIIYIGAVHGHKGVYDPISNEISFTKITDTNITHVDIREIQVYNYNNKDLILIANDGGVGRSFDGGATWEDITGTGLNIAQFYKIGISPNNRKLLGGLQDIGIHIYSNGDWRHSNIGNDGGNCLVDPFNPIILFQQGWQHVDNPNSSMARLLERTEDDGQIWDDFYDTPITALQTNSNHIRAMEIHSNGKFFTVTDQVFYRDRYGVGEQPTTWVQIGDILTIPPYNGEKKISAIAVAPSDPDIVYVARENHFGGVPKRLIRLRLPA